MLPVTPSLLHQGMEKNIFSGLWNLNMKALFCSYSTNQNSKRGRIFGNPGMQFKHVINYRSQPRIYQIKK